MYRFLALPKKMGEETASTFDLGWGAAPKQMFGISRVMSNIEKMLVEGTQAKNKGEPSLFIPQEKQTRKISITT